MKLTQLLLLALLLLLIKTQDGSDSSDTSGSDSGSDESTSTEDNGSGDGGDNGGDNGDGDDTIPDPEEVIRVNSTQELTRNQEQQESLATLLAAIQAFKARKEAAGEEATVTSGDGSQVPVDEISFDESCIGRHGSALKKISHDPAFSIDRWSKWESGGLNLDCLANQRVLCQSMWKLTRPAYLSFNPPLFAWGERTVIASNQKMFGCHMNFKEAGTILCQYWFGAGWEWHKNDSGRFFYDMWGTAYSYNNWPLDDATPGKEVMPNEYYTYGSVPAAAGEPFWVESNTDVTCYIPV